MTERTVTTPNGWSRTQLDGFRAGRPEVLAEIYRAHAREVAVLLRHGFEFSAGGRRHRFTGYGSSFELQDALHETFRRAFEPRARDGYDGLRPYGPYVRTIARNVVLSQFRRQRRVFVPIDDVGEGADSGSPGTGAGITIEADLPAPDRVVHDAQVGELVRAFLASLSVEDRALVECRFVEGLSQRDAAQRLSLGRQRIRTKEIRIRRELVKFLAARGELGLLAGTGEGLALLLLGPVSLFDVVSRGLSTLLSEVIR